MRECAKQLVEYLRAVRGLQRFAERADFADAVKENAAARGVAMAIPDAVELERMLEVARRGEKNASILSAALDQLSALIDAKITTEIRTVIDEGGEEIMRLVTLAYAYDVDLSRLAGRDALPVVFLV